MAAKLNSADVNQKMDDGQDDKLPFHDSKTTDLKSPVRAHSVDAGVFTEKIWLWVMDCRCLWICNFVLYKNCIIYIFPFSCRTGFLTEVTSFSEKISTEDTELSSTDISMNANKTAGTLCYIFYINNVGRSIQIFYLKVARAITSKSSAFKILMKKRCT